MEKKYGMLFLLFADPGSLWPLYLHFLHMRRNIAELGIYNYSIIPRISAQMTTNAYNLKLLVKTLFS